MNLEIIHTYDFLPEKGTSNSLVGIGTGTSTCTCGIEISECTLEVEFAESGLNKQGLSEFSEIDQQLSPAFRTLYIDSMDKQLSFNGALNTNFPSSRMKKLEMFGSTLLEVPARAFFKKEVFFGILFEIGCCDCFLFWLVE